ncbi:MAG: hypothetical protein ACJ75S_04005 [Solirubrobacterales bacterium]
MTAGVQSTLALTSITHRADNDGTIWRRPLRGVLSEAVPVALPATTPGLPLEHLRLGDAPGQLVHELADTGITVAFLALPAKEPAGLVEAEPLVDSFVDGFREAAAAVSLEAVFVPLVADMSLVGSLSSVQRGSARDYALAGVLNFWREVARRAPSPGEAQ